MSITPLFVTKIPISGKLTLDGNRTRGEINVELSFDDYNIR